MKNYIYSYSFTEIGQVIKLYQNTWFTFWKSKHVRIPIHTFSLSPVIEEKILDLFLVLF